MPREWVALTKNNDKNLKSLSKFTYMLYKHLIAHTFLEMYGKWACIQI